MICLALLTLLTRVTSQKSCSLENSKIDLRIESTGTLGLRLDDDLKITDFVSTSNGRPHAIEASGLIEIGDQIIAVNEDSLEHVSLQQAVQVLNAANVPRTISFRPYDGRCMASDLTSALDIKEELVPSVDGVGYVITNTEAGLERFYGKLAEFGPQTVACNFHRIHSPQPLTSCAPIQNRVHGGVVYVGNSGGCPLHEKALQIQDAGGIAVVFSGDKLGRAKLPPGVNKDAVKIPVIMVNKFTGDIIHQALQATHSRRKRAEDALHVEKVQDEDKRLHAAKAGRLVVQGDEGIQFEYIKAEFGGRLRIDIAYPVYLVTSPEERCPSTSSSDESKPIYDGMLVITALGECSIEEQILGFSSKGVKALALVDNESEMPYRLSSSTISSGAATVSFPVVMLSSISYNKLIMLAEDIELRVKFETKDEIAQHWEELEYLADPLNWPSTKRDQDRLFHRIIRAHAEQHDLEVASERHQMLKASYDKARHHYHS